MSESMRSWEFLIPLRYSLASRYRQHIVFMMLFDWTPAVLVCALFSIAPIAQALMQALLCYIAFQCHYELGYMFNDLVATRWEKDPRQRATANAGVTLFALCVLVRLGLLLMIGSVLGLGEDLFWWTYHGGMAVIFLIHNLLRAASYKVCTFQVLAVGRFMAPVIFVVEPGSQGYFFCAAVLLYANFRTLSYLESKGLLSIPNRRSAEFRLSFFTSSGLLGCWSYLSGGLQPFAVLALYYFLLALFYWVKERVVRRSVKI